jgi:hypothetical protein
VAALYDVPRQSLELLPQYARIAATLHQALKDVGPALVAELQVRAYLCLCVRCLNNPMLKALPLSCSPLPFTPLQLTESTLPKKQQSDFRYYQQTIHTINQPTSRTPPDKPTNQPHPKNPQMQSEFRYYQRK